MCLLAIRNWKCSRISGYFLLVQMKGQHFGVIQGDQVHELSLNLQWTKTLKKINELFFLRKLLTCSVVRSTNKNSVEFFHIKPFSFANHSLIKMLVIFPLLSSHLSLIWDFGTQTSIFPFDTSKAFCVSRFTSTSISISFVSEWICFMATSSLKAIEFLQALFALIDFVLSCDQHHQTAFLYKTSSPLRI